MPCAAPYIPGHTYHTSEPDTPTDVKTLMRHGFPAEMAHRIVDSRGMDNWEVLQTDCTALFWKKHWDRMDYRIAYDKWQRETGENDRPRPSEACAKEVITAGSAGEGSAGENGAVPERGCKCVIA
ncbi:hypothetical protein Dda_1419 [Drechslerella dactyloides]|uniref:Uncharacterized protein n=1 Tax=Drechslerella dactyloides TaxID=74499 RepID=A0AAD6J307_DREDA|nr:hypothetical protein Dda_1419 [Drechslerella dactyloides]